MELPPNPLSMLPLHKETQNAQGGRSGRKKMRDMSRADDSLDDHFDIGDDGRPKTRRVNPQRLALRLGQDLVAEMEALIVPGAKMPSFAVRKDFQERYCVDRRHIYDYFHSRGLRVAKEDKHTNLIRGRAMKAAAAAAAAASTVIATEASDAVQGGMAPKVQEGLLHTMPVKSSKPEAKAYKTLPKKKKADKLPSRRVFLAPADERTSQESSSPISDLPSFSSTPMSISSLSTVYSRKHGSTLPNLYAQGEGSDTSNGQDASPNPAFFSSPDELQPYASLATSSLLGHNSMLFQDELGGISSDGYHNFFDSEYGQEEQALSPQERSELYARISNSLHLAPLTIETAATYDTYQYMKDRTPFPRYPGLNFGPTFIRQNNFHAEYSSSFPYNPNDEASPDLLDLRSWLSEDPAHESELAGHGHLMSTSSISACLPGLVAKYASDGTIHA